jgi:hypothetical protein
VIASILLADGSGTRNKEWWSRSRKQSIQPD